MLYTTWSRVLVILFAASSLMGLLQLFSDSPVWGVVLTYLCGMLSGGLGVALAERRIRDE